MLNTITWLENLEELQLGVDARQIVEQIKLENHMVSRCARSLSTKENSKLG